DQIDIDDADEFRQRIDAVLAYHALRAADAGAVHQHARHAMRGFRLRNRGLHRLLVGDVGMQRDALDLGRDLFGIFLVLVEHADLGAFGRHGAGGGGAETGATAGNEYGNVFQLHLNYLSLGVSSLDLQTSFYPAATAGLLGANMPPKISASMCLMYSRQTSSVTGPTPTARDIACRAKNR